MRIRLARILSSFLTAWLVGQLWFLSGCTSSTRTAAGPPPPADTPDPIEVLPVRVLTKDSTFYELMQYQLAGSTLYGSGFSERSGAKKYFDGYLQLSDVDYVEVDPGWTGGKTLLLLVGILAFSSVAIAYAEGSRNDFTFDVKTGFVGPPGGGGESCPFFYTYDGEEYHFESESFAGAVFRGAEYASYDVLEHLKPVDGTYRLQMTNERQETHYVNEVKILAVDAPADVAILPDPTGGLHTISQQQHPLRCVDFKGNDMRARVLDADGDYWESDLASLDMTKDEDLRDGLVLEFEKPPDANHAKLVVNGINTPLGIYAF